MLNNTARRVGIYLIDLPKQFISAESASFRYDYNEKINMTTQQQYLSSFKQMLAYRKQKLKNTQSVDAIDRDFLKAIHPVPTSNPEKI